MKYIWEVEDVKYGMMYHRGDAHEFCSDKGEYAMSCLHKICCVQTDRMDKDGDGNCVYFTTAMSDGLVFRLGTAEEVVASMNEGEYRPTTTKEMVYIATHQARNMRLWDR